MNTVHDNHRQSNEFEINKGDFTLAGESISQQSESVPAFAFIRSLNVITDLGTLRNAQLALVNI